MKKTIITLAAFAGVGIASLGGVAAFTGPASASASSSVERVRPVVDKTAAMSHDDKTAVPDDVDPALQAWYDSNGKGERPAGVKVVGSPAEVAALQTSADAEGKCYQSRGYDVPIADTAAGDGVQVPENVTKADMDHCMTLGQDLYDSEYKRLGGK